MRSLEDRSRPDRDLWGRNATPWRADAEAGFTMNFDGPPLTVMAEHAPRGTASVGLAHLNDPGDTTATVSGSATLLSFNLGAKRGAIANWKGSGRRFDYSVRPGLICIIPPKMEVEGANASHVEVLAMWVPSDLLSLASAELNIAGGQVIERVGIEDPRLLRLAMTLASELQGGLSGGAMLWTELSAILALHLSRRHFSHAAERKSPTITSANLKRVNEFIAEALDRPITLDDLATAVGDTRFRFLRAFAKTVGMTPYRYVMHRRLQAAVAMARSCTEPAAAIAYATGFADQSHLYRWCKRVYGIRFSEARCS